MFFSLPAKQQLEQGYCLEKQLGELFDDEEKTSDFCYLCALKRIMELQLNGHNKQECPPMHTTVHVLNQTMVRMFGCARSKNTHIERNKSKADYFLSQPPTSEQVQAIEASVNEIIGRHLPVSEEFLPISAAVEIVDLSKLPDNVSGTLRIVRIGDYDVCACIGSHVGNTSEIGRFEIISHDFSDGRWRVRFKLR